MASLSSPSVCINDVLSLHLLVEILSRLPMRLVFQCKTVCKVWLSCIQGNDSGFIGQFIQRNGDHDLQQKQIMIPVALNRSEMVLVQPSCTVTVTVTDAELSLAFLPFIDESVPPQKRSEVVLASSNGLLLCSPNNSRYAEYYICNPLTRQWIALPRPPRSKECTIGGAAFTCDPFYNVDSSSMNDHFGVKVIRLLLTYPHISADVFSNRTGWSSLELPARIGRTIRLQCPPVSLSGKIHWLLRDSDITVYDPETQEIIQEGVASGPPTEELYFQLGTIKHFVGFCMVSVCRGSFWLGQALNAHLRVFNLVNGVWHLEHDVNTFREMEWSSSSVKQKVLTRPRAIVFWTMHPSDPMIAYVSVGGSFIECDFRDRTMKVVSEQEGNLSNVVMLSLPPWPTPLPAISTTN